MEKFYERVNLILSTIVKISIVMATIIAIGILILTFIGFFNNQFMFADAFDNILVDFIDTMTNDCMENEEVSNELISIRMQYLERLSSMHRQATERDLFVFMYGFLSSILIGASAYLLKRGERQVTVISEKHSELVQKYEALFNKYEEISEIAEINSEQIISHKSTIFLNFISQGLSEALILIATYNHNPETEYLVQFKASIRQVALWCEKVEFEKAEKLIVDKFGQRLGIVIGLYESAADKYVEEITDTHKKHTHKDFEKIRSYFSKKSK